MGGLPVNVGDFKRPSLLELFTPPKGERGVFGLMCGLSADEYFMDAAMERFSDLSSSQRRQHGRLFALLCLDARSRPMQLLAGVYGPWAIGSIWAKIGLMHAKVALLGFGESSAGKADYYRLIVSTGNWTKEAVNKSINLAWFCDYDTRNREPQRQSAADIIKSAMFWQRLLGVGRMGSSYYQIDDVVNEQHVKPFLNTISGQIIKPKRGYKSQFISNLLPDQKGERTENFALDSIGGQVINHLSSDKKRRNLIICGSGFFEMTGKNKTKLRARTKEPTVLSDLITELKRRILTSDPFKWLVINTKTSGAVGQWIKGSDPDAFGWELRRPLHPDVKAVRQPYPFHAKYVFVGNWNASITNGRIYIGSGNLSRQGFTLGLEYGGNIEAGVVINTARYDRKELCFLLGVDHQNDLQPDEILLEELQGEDSEQDGTEIHASPPVMSFVFETETKKLTFRRVDSTWTNLVLTFQEGHKEVLSKDQTEVIVSEVTVDFSTGIKLTAERDGQSTEWVMPVFNREGMFCPPPRQPKTGHEIIEALVAFPRYVEEDDEDDGLDVPDGEESSRASSPKDEASELRKALDKFPLHLGTTLIETVAEQNQQVTIGQMPDWIEHLRRTLIDEMKPETKRDLATLDQGLLSPLISTSGFAPQQSTRAYKRTIQEIADNWCRSQSESHPRKVDA